MNKDLAGEFSGKRWYNCLELKENSAPPAFPGGFSDVRDSFLLLRSSVLCQLPLPCTVAAAAPALRLDSWHKGRSAAHCHLSSLPAIAISCLLQE